MSSLSALGLLSLIGSLMATPTVAESAPLYASAQLAAKAAADIYNPLSIREDREYMGSIYIQDGRFGYTVAAGRPGEDEISIRIPMIDWETVVAFWHTHGDAAPRHRYFSDIDTDLVRKFDKPFYLADYTGFLKVFRPGAKTLSVFAARRLGLPASQGFATGDVVRDRHNRTVRVNTRDNHHAS